MWESVNETPGWMFSTIDVVALHPYWALSVSFLAAIVEAVAIVGTIVPGTVIVMGVAGAAAAANQPLLPFVATAALGAMLGDFLSYWLGYHYRRTVRQWWPLVQQPRLLTGADRFFARYGAFSVALCRFVPVLRSTVPLIAGITGLPRGRFLLANVASALVWAPLHVCPAQLAGLSIDRLRTAGEWGNAAWLGAGVLVCGAALWMLHRRLTPPEVAARR